MSSFEQELERVCLGTPLLQVDSIEPKADGNSSLCGRLKTGTICQKSLRPASVQTSLKEKSQALARSPHNDLRRELARWSWSQRQLLSTRKLDRTGGVDFELIEKLSFNPNLWFYNFSRKVCSLR